jgi:HK97 gp10 family phage protein
MASKFSRLDKRKLEQMIRQQPRVVDDALRETGLEIVMDAQTSMGSSPPGRTYGSHVASQPGYPPNPDSGALRASIHLRKTANGYVVEDGTDHGYLQEVGTSRMKARPFLRPAFVRGKQAFIRRIRAKYQ